MRAGDRPRPAPGALRTAALLSLALLGAGSCADDGPRRSGDPSLDVRVGLSPTPPLVGEAGVRVEARSREATLDDSATVRVRVGEGRWTALSRSGRDAWTGTLRFPAPGHRQLTVEVRAGDGRRARFVQPVTVSAAPAAHEPDRAEPDRGAGGGPER